MKTARILSIIVFIFMHFSGFSQVEKYMAAFTYQICKATTWPEQSDYFVIGTMGESDIIPYFEQMAKDKKIGGKPIKLKTWNMVSEIETCQVIFITNDKISDLNKIASAIGNRPVLIFTENQGTIKKGANLSFKIIDNKIRYNLNKSDILKRNLIVGINIERMALKVY